MFVLKSKYEELKDKLEEKENIIYKLEKDNKSNSCILNDLIKNNYCEESQEVDLNSMFGKYKYLIGKYKLVITFRRSSDRVELFEDGVNIFEIYTNRENSILIQEKLGDRIEELKKLEADINIINKRKKK